MRDDLKHQTLHGHTTTSDGKLSYLEVLSLCPKYGVGVYAFTDHDSLPSEKVISKLKKYDGPVKWISGIEISSGLPKELGSKGSQHVTGLFVDPFNKALTEHCKKAQAARVERMGKIVKNLRKLGFEITADDCLKASGGEAIGRPHIVEVIKKKHNNLKVMEKLRIEMEKASKKDMNIKEKYDMMMERGEDQYPYVLFLSGDAFVKGISVDYTYKVDLDKSVELIRKAGGVAILAHWFTGKKNLTEKVLDGLFEKNRLDGAETVYGIWSKGSIKRSNLEKDRGVLKKLLEKYNKLESGGCDVHREKDLEVFSKTKWYADMTSGLSEKLIKQSQVDTTWSSFS